MSRSFTLVPENVLLATQDLLRSVTLDPAVVIKVDAITSIFFAGDAAVAKEAPSGAGLACLRILGTGVLQVDLDGYEASVEQAARYVCFAITTFRCRVFDDETGRELTSQARIDPRFLFAAL